MRCFFLLIFLFSFCVTQSQDAILSEKITEIKTKIGTAKKEDKLKLLDSLCSLTLYKSEFKYDSIVKATINLAIELEAEKLAVKHSADHIFYLANRANRPKEATQIFNDFLNRDLNKVPPLAMAKLYLNGADGYFFSGQTFESIDYYKKANEYAEKANDSVLMGKSFIYMSDAYADSGKFAEAGSILSKAQDIFENTKDTLNLLTTYNSRANLYSRINFYKEAKDIRDEIVELALKRKDYRMLQSTYYNMAIDNGEEDKIEQRIFNLNEALKYAKLGGFESYEMRILIALFQVNSASNNLAEATKLFNSIKEHPLRPKDGGLDNFNYKKALTHFQLALGDNMRAINLGKNLLELDAKNDFSNSMSTHRILAKAYENIGNSKKSYKHYKIFSEIRDSINRIQNVKSLTYYQTLYETEKRDFKIASQQNEIVVLDKENKINKQWMLFGGISLFALMILIYVRYKEKNKRTILENKLLSAEIEYKKKDLKHFALDITHNKEWALILVEKLDKIKSSTGKKRTLELDILESEIKNKIRVDENTEDFHNKIELLSSSFYEKLKSEFPDLTKTEIRLCSLIRLNMDTKQIAILQNINPSSVKMSRNRLRKKLNVNSEINLHNFLNKY